MLVKFLGILDIIAAVIFWSFSFFHLFPKSFLVVSAFYLLIKGLIFVLTGDLISFFDIGCSVFLFLALIFTLPKLLVILVTFFLIQKGVISLLA